MEPIPKAEFSIVTRTSSKAWLPELIASAGPEVTDLHRLLHLHDPQREYSAGLRAGLLAVF